MKVTYRNSDTTTIEIERHDCCREHHEHAHLSSGLQRELHRQHLLHPR